ncbi:MAG: hypothetical protein QM760_17795 [Nibricoccus sp.]
MKTPLLATVLLAFATLSHAALDVRTASVARQTIAIDGNAIPEIRSWSGGESVSEVITARNGGSGVTSKILGRLTYEPIVVEAAPPFSPALQSCIAQFLGGSDTAALTSAKKTLLLAYLDASGQPIGDTIQATGAQLTEIQFPTVDAASRTPLLVKFVFRVDATAPVTTAIPAAAGGGNARNTALASNFTLAIDGVSTSRVSKVDAFTLRREVITNTSGNNASTSFSIGELTVPNLVVTLGGADSDSWKIWRASFLPQPDATTINRVQKKNGALRFLASDMTTSLFTLQLSGLAPVRFATVPPDSAAAALLQFRGEVFCEAMSTFTGNGLLTAVSPSPAASKVIARDIDPDKTLVDKAVVAPVAGETSPDDKGARDPADFPRPPDVVRTSFSSSREPNSVREIAYYAGKTSAAAIITFYEKSLAIAGWKETSRQEDNGGPGKTFRITSNWTKEKRSAQLVLGDIAPQKIEIYVNLLEKK